MMEVPLTLTQITYSERPAKGAPKGSLSLSFSLFLFLSVQEKNIYSSFSKEDISRHYSYYNEEKTHYIL